MTDRDIELLSAYLDDQLAPREKHKLEERLRTQPDLQTELEALSRTRALLRSAPRRRAPRNFTLTPAMVADLGPRRKRGSFLNFFPALSFASALAAFALVASLGLELFLGVGGAPASLMAAKEAAPAAAPMAAMQDQAVPAAEGLPAPTQSAESMRAMENSAGSQDQAPPVITWEGGQQGGMGGGPEAGKMAPAPSGMGGGGNGNAPDGSIVVPLEGVESFTPPAAEKAMAAPTATPPASGMSIAENPVTAAEPTSVVATEMSVEEKAAGDQGPILGIPPAESAGEIASSSGDGTSYTESSQPLSAEQETSARGGGWLWLTPLRVTQILLGLLAVATGATAYVLRKRQG